jgi:hypothetical protein
MQDLVMKERLPFLPPTVPPPPVHEKAGNAATASEDVTQAMTPTPAPFSTARNAFGVYKQYKYLDPHYIDPEGFVEGADLVESNIAAVIDQRSEGLNKALLDDLLPSSCALRLAEWYWKEGSDKSVRSFQSLIDIISSDEFQSADIKNTNWRKVYAVLGLTVEEKAALEGLEKEELGSWFTETSWKKKDVPVDVPFDSDTALPGTHRYWVRNFYYRPLLDVVREKLSSLEVQERFHLLPYELCWKPNPDTPEMRLHGEMYASQAFAKAHQELLVSACFSAPSLADQLLSRTHLQNQAVLAHVTLSPSCSVQTRPNWPHLAPLLSGPCISSAGTNLSMIGVGRASSWANKSRTLKRWV